MPFEKGKRGWPVPGVKVPYEKPSKPEITIDTSRESPEETVEKIIEMLYGGEKE